MNVGIFTDTYYPEINGVAVSVSMLEKELRLRGHKVYIFTTTNPNIKARVTGVFRLASMPFVFLPSRRVGLVYSHNTAKAIKRLKLDIIHTQTEFSLGLFGKLMARNLGIPVIHTYHTMYKDFAHYISKGLFVKVTDELARIMSRNFCNSCYTVVAPTQKVYDLLKGYGVKHSIRVIPTGIDFSNFRREAYSEGEAAELKKRYGIGLGDPVVLFVGRLAKEKSVDVILRQFPALLKKLPQARFLIVGDGPVRKELAALAESLGIKDSVIFAGEQPWKGIGRFYRAADAFVSASVTETQGLTFAEAMAAGLPVVAKKDQSIEAFIIDRKTGRTFKEDSELPELLYEVLTNREAAQRLVQNSARIVQELSSEQFGARIEAVYFEVLGKAMRMKAV